MLRLLFRQIEELIEGVAAGLQDELLGRLGGQILHVLTGLTHDLLTAALGHGLRVGDDLLGLGAGGVELRRQHPSAPASSPRGSRRRRR